MKTKFFAPVAFVLLAAAVTVPAQGGMMLTAAGTTAGFTLSTFAYGFENTGSNGVGPVGIGFLGGNVYVSDYQSGNLRIFGDTDNQNAASVSAASNLGGQIAGLSNLNGTMYAVNQGSGQLFKLHADGTLNSTVVTGLGPATGMTAANNNLYVSNVSGEVYKIDPTIPATSALITGYVIDGVTADAANNVLYGTSVGGGNTRVYGFNLTTGAFNGFDSGYIAGADGAAVGTGSLAGNIFVNTNDGKLWEVNVATSVQTLIASGGSRGDLVSVDPNGTVLLTQTDSVLRLTAPAGSSFDPGGATPEPGTTGMMLSGLVAVVYGLRRRARA